MKQFNLLFRVSFQGLIHSLGFRGKNKRKTDRSGWMNLALTLLLNVLFAVLYGGQLAMVFFNVGTPQVFVAIMALMAIVFCSMFTLLGAKEVVFSTRDIDLVLSLPVNGRLIMLSRLAALYLENAMLTTVWMLFAGIAWVAMRKDGLVYLPLFFIMGLLVAIIPTLISLLIGVIMAVTSACSGGKPIAENIMYLVGTLFLLVFVLGVQRIQITQNVPSKMSGLLKPFQWIGDACAGDWMAWFLVLLVTVLPMAVVVLLCGRFYNELLGSLTAKGSKNNYKLGQLKHSSATKGLLKKEWLRYINTPIYLMNTGIILLMYFAGTIAFAIKSDWVWGQIAASGLQQLPTLGLAAGFTGFFLASILISPCSISLEGNSFWILQTMPVSADKVLSIKALFHWLMCAPFLILGGLLIGFGARMDVVSAALLVLMSLVFAWCVAVVGLIINLKLPKLDGSSDTVVVKQSASVAVSMLVNTILLVILGVVWYLAGRSASQTFAAMICLAIMVVIALAVTLVLKKKGAAMLNDIVP